MFAVVHNTKAKYKVKLAYTVVMKEQNAERLSEYEKAQIEFAKGKAEFLQGCGGCLMIPIIIIILLCIVILIGLIASPFMD